MQHLLWFKKRFSNEKATILTVIIFSLISRAFWLNTLIERDEGCSAYVAWRWLNGELPFVETGTIQGPMRYVFYVLPMSLFGNNIIPIRILTTLLFIVSIYFVFLLGKEWYRKRIGIISAIIYAFGMNIPVFEGQLAMSESNLVPLTVMSIYCAHIYLSSGRRISLFVSGVLMSLTFLTKQSAGVGLIVLAFMLFLTMLYNGNRDNSIFFRTRYLSLSLLVLMISFLIPLGAFTIYYWANGAEAVFLNTMFQKPFEYIKTEGVIPFDLRFLIIVEGLPIWILAISGCITTILRRRKEDVILLVWFMLFLCVAMIPPGFGHYYLMTLPAASLLSGRFLSALFLNRSPRYVGYKLITAFMIAIMGLSILCSVYFQVQHYPNFKIKWHFVDRAYADSLSYSKQIDLANFLRENTESNETLLIYGRSSEIYWLAGIPATSRYVWSLPGDMPADKYVALVEEVRQARFKYVVHFASSQEQLIGRESDLIVNATLTTYSITKYIGNALVYERNKNAS